MQLKDFVQSVIADIIGGINEASKNVADSGALVNPPHVYIESGKYGDHMAGEFRSDGARRLVHNIHFDVALTVSQGKGTHAGLGIAIADIGIGAKGKSESSQSNTSRVRFSIPVAYPERSEREST